MNLKLQRAWFTDKSTVGSLYLDGMVECYILEDVCREAKPFSWQSSYKIAGKTAIPYGRYQIIITFSERFQRPLPLLVGVPDFEGVRIHPGNAAEDTDGCLLPGITRETDRVTSSRL